MGRDRSRSRERRKKRTRSRSKERKKTSRRSRSRSNTWSPSPPRKSRRDEDERDRKDRKERESRRSREKEEKTSSSRDEKPSVKADGKKESKKPQEVAPQSQEDEFDIDRVIEGEDALEEPVRISKKDVEVMMVKQAQLMEARRSKVLEWRQRRKDKDHDPIGLPSSSSTTTTTTTAVAAAAEVVPVVKLEEPVVENGAVAAVPEPSLEPPPPLPELVGVDYISESSDAQPKKGWTLEDDNEDEEGEAAERALAENGQDEDAKTDTNMEEEEEDPLEAYMKQIKKETKKTIGGTGVRRVVVSAAAVEKDKGEIMTNDDEPDFTKTVDDYELPKGMMSIETKGKRLAKTDHTKVYYRPFRKNFYTEVPDLARMTKAEVDEYRKELDDIKIRGGKDCPRPVKSFAQCGFSEKIMAILRKMEYEKPTPIQAQALPAILSGRDVIGIAKTGSGKTLAFLLPLMRHVLDQDALEDLDGPIAVVLAPTRELCVQTWREASKFAKPHGLRVVCVYGGVGISEQIGELRSGAEIVVCTPGRMIDMLAANNGRVTNLRRCTYLVLDEADRMFDMGFEPQITKIIDNVRPDRQTVLFSATFPRQMDTLARKVLNRPIEITVGGRSVVSSDVAQNACICETDDIKVLKLLELLGIYCENGGVIVFVEKQERADQLVSLLMRHGYTCAPLHGGIDQFDRESAISDFKANKFKVLVATSVAARGLDVKGVVLVVNYDCPDHYEDYVHRCGRTGRAGAKGHAWTFINPEGQEKMAGEVCRGFALASMPEPQELKQMWETFREKMKQEGKEIKLGAGGFGGHGYRYDADEEEAEEAKRRMTKLVMELDHNDDDDIDEQLHALIKVKRHEVVGPPPGAQKVRLNAEATERVNAARAKADAIAAALNLNKDDASGGASGTEKDIGSQTAAAVMRGEDATNIEISASQRAKQIAAKLAEKLAPVEPQAALPEAAQGDTRSYFEEELDINDFPPQTRFRICSRDAIAQICDYAEVGVTVKGVHVPPGKNTPRGEQRLSLLLEARQELMLHRAKEEVVRIIRESLRQLAASGRMATPQGRYKVV